MSLLREMRVAEIYASWAEAVPVGNLGTDGNCVIYEKVIAEVRSLLEIDFLEQESTTCNGGSVCKLLIPGSGIVLSEIGRASCRERV